MAGKQRYLCRDCCHQWRLSHNKLSRYTHSYRDYLTGRKTLTSIANELRISTKTLTKYFDAIEVDSSPKSSLKAPINLVLDATFFGRSYGYLCFHDTHQVIYAHEIKTEKMSELEICIHRLIEAGYTFKSFTLDGKRGFISLLQRMFPQTPIQMCLFHQKAIVRRYITLNPKSECGQNLKRLMADICEDTQHSFQKKFDMLRITHKQFLIERNEQGQFKHRRLRSAIRSIKTNLPFMFTYQNYLELKIPHTTNHLEGIFAHLKERIQIHRGLRVHRRKKAIIFLLNL